MRCGGRDECAFHDGTVYFYAYDPKHWASLDATDCANPGVVPPAGTPLGVLLGFNKVETTSTPLTKSTCIGTNVNMHNADYNISLFPHSP